MGEVSSLCGLCAKANATKARGLAAVFLRYAVPEGGAAPFFEDVFTPPLYRAAAFRLDPLRGCGLAFCKSNRSDGVPDE